METRLDKMPVVFIGHGSPMNAIANNSYTKMLSALGKRLPLPKAVLVVSAHWVTEGTRVTSMAHPKTIHDFYGFPKPLFDVQYNAPGNATLAHRVQELVKVAPVDLDHADWGLDHGTWAVLKHMYPEAKIPVLQLSISADLGADGHYKLGQDLRALRSEGILILGSGNLVHNLRAIDWKEDAKPHDWAVEFDQWTKKALLDRNFDALIHDALKTKAGQLSIPTAEHYLPMHYILGASEPGDELKFEFEELQNASIAMRSFSFGA